METTFREYLLNYSHLAALICCLFFNSLLCLCLFLERHTQLKLYRNVLYIQCTSDIIAGIFYYFASFRFVMIDGIFFAVYVNPNRQGDFISILGIQLPTNYFMMYCYLHPICLGLMFVPLNFYFRYKQLCL